MQKKKKKSSDILIVCTRHNTDGLVIPSSYQDVELQSLEVAMLAPSNLKKQVFFEFIFKFRENMLNRC